MGTTNLNVRVEQDDKKAVETILSDIGMNLSTAINVYIKQIIKENGIPFELRAKTPNAKTIAAIEEGRRIAYDKNVVGYTNIDDLKEALDI